MQLLLKNIKILPLIIFPVIVASKILKDTNKAEGCKDWNSGGGGALNVEEKLRVHEEDFTFSSCS